jgi:hypothetical protein
MLAKGTFDCTAPHKMLGPLVPALQLTGATAAEASALGELFLTESSGVAVSAQEIGEGMRACDLHRGTLLARQGVERPGYQERDAAMIAWPQRKHNSFTP